MGKYLLRPIGFLKLRLIPRGRPCRRGHEKAVFQATFLIENCEMVVKLQ